MGSLRSLRSIVPLAAAIACLLGNKASSQDTSLTLISGNVTLAAIFPVKQATSSGNCGSYDVDSIQGVAAVKWLVEELNKMDYVPGVTLGLEAYLTCGDPEKAVDATATLLQRYEMGTGSSVNDSLLFGILGPATTSEAIAVSRFIGLLPDNKRVFQISGSATGQTLSNRTLYPNFFRVIPPDSTQVQAMAELLEALDWNYVAIVYDDDDYGGSAATELRRLAQDRQICVPVFESLPPLSDASFSNRVSAIVDKVTSLVLRGAVIIAGPETSSRVMKDIGTAASYVEFILSEATGLRRDVMETATGTAIQLAQGALITSPDYFDVAEFGTFWNNLWNNRNTFTAQVDSNPWLEEFYKEKTGCSDLGSTCWNGMLNKRQELLVSGGNTGNGLNLYTWYHLKAAAAMAKLVKQVHSTADAFENAIKNRASLQSTLEGATLSLNDLVSVSSAFSGVSVSFNVRGDVLQPTYSVYNYRRENSNFVFKKVGTFSAQTLTVDKTQTEFYNNSGETVEWNKLSPAQCPVNRDCDTCQKDLSGHVVFMEGDFYVVAMVAVYAKHPDNALKCGDINAYSGADLAEALIFAVNDINKKNGEFSRVLQGSTVGLLVINTCGNPLIVRRRLLDLHSGRLTLPDGRNTSFLLPKIMGYVGAFYSSSSIAASDTLTAIGGSFVEVSGTSTSPVLSDRQKHPYFMRLVPPDSAQAKVFLDVATRLDATYIQVLYDESTSYARDLLSEILKEIGKNDRYHDICIAQTIAVTPRSDISQYKWIVDKLRDKSNAKVIIVIQHEQEVIKTMKAILPSLTDADNFVFVGSEAWGRREQIIEGQTKLQGSLVVSQEIAVDQVFQRQFHSQDPRNPLDPWLMPFWEKRENCYFNKSFSRMGKTHTCSSDIFNDYAQDTWAPFYINCVKALVLGFSQALTEHCGARARQKCEELTSDGLVEAMKGVKLDLYSNGRDLAVFDSNGDGLGGFKVLQVVRDLTSADTKMVYQDVGTWTQNSLTLETGKLRLPGGSEFKSVCPNDIECTKCVSSVEPPPGNTSECSGESTGLSQPVTVGVGAGLGAVIIILIIIIIILVVCRRRTGGAQYRSGLNDGPAVRTSAPNHYSGDIPMKSLSQGRSMMSLQRDFSGASVSGSASGGTMHDVSGGGFSLSSRGVPPVPREMEEGFDLGSLRRGMHSNTGRESSPYDCPYDVPRPRSSGHPYETSISVSS